MEKLFLTYMNVRLGAPVRIVITKARASWRSRGSRGGCFDFLAPRARTFCLNAPSATKARMATTSTRRRRRSSAAWFCAARRLVRISFGCRASQR